MATLEQAVKSASAERVVLAGARLGAGALSYPFFDADNPLTSSNAESQIDVILGRRASSEDVDSLAAFLTIAVSFHVLEGWRYLSKAAYALLNASRKAALHLAYYAELRAARSILAGSGICIRDTWHFAITEPGEIITFGAPRSSSASRSKPKPCSLAWAHVRDCLNSRLGRKQVYVARLTQKDEIISTHVAASDALKAWSRVTKNGERVAEAVRSLSLSNVDWAEACRASSSTRAQLAENWLMDWSVDLKGMQADSATRNIASYGISLSSDTFAALSRDELEFVCSTHRACLSDSEGGFDGIDLALLRDFCLKSGRLALGKNYQQIWRKLRQWLSDQGGKNRYEARALVKQVQQADQSPAGRVIKLADRNNRTPEGVFARAFLLLRLATILQTWLWKQIRPKAPDGNPQWPNTILRHFATWSCLEPHETTPEEYLDLEEDQKTALDDIAAWLGANTFGGPAVWNDECAALRELCRFERAALRTLAS